MKKTIYLILSIIFLLSFAGCGDETVSSKTPLPGGAGNYEAGDFKYQVQEDGTAFVKYIGKASEVVFPEEISGYKVTGIQTMNFWHSETIVKVTIPSSVRVIEVEAFSECPNLKTVVLNEGLTTIESRAFMNSPNLTNITLPHTLTSIGNRAFYGCNSLKSVHIAKGIKKLEAEAFALTGIESVTFDEGVEEIGDNVFAATQIREITFPKTLKTLEYGVLSSNKNLTKVSLNEGLETMGSHIFAKCPKLSEIIIPSTVKTVTDFTFDHNENIKAIKFEGDAPENFVNEDWEVKVWPVDYTVYYHKSAKGFTSSTWNGYRTEIW